VGGKKRREPFLEMRRKWGKIGRVKQKEEKNCERMGKGNYRSQKTFG